MKNEKDRKTLKERHKEEKLQKKSPQRFDEEFSDEPMTPVELDRNKLTKKC
ncbi:small acid-soluble spore protein O [Amphibacillus sp. Q70]|uniref:small acid-soluble spore protein O n=1 Tax=Amphibacillus sp. Q70 TaxID=3453416 RepID=UPI003F873718